jgi:hypothetical protein
MQPLNHMVFESFRQTYSKELSWNLIKK